ncbi:hypothetical protein FJZ53_01720 [Candidatus Woesearchaeota archaeon]|nr:hypothetical protein [Candidatus Woesearchaeota archaeon]
MRITKKKIISSLVSIVTTLSLSYGVANADLVLKKDGSKVYNYYLDKEDKDSVTVKNGKGEELRIPRSEIKDYVTTKQDIDEETALLIQELKSFEDWGETKLGVPKSDNYLAYDKNFETLHILLYCKEMELPKTYFELNYEQLESEEKAEARKAELESQGYEVYYRTAESVANDSTISQDLLDADLFREIFVIFHENSHDLTDLPIDIDEAAASIAGYYGALEYFKEKFGENSQEYKEAAKRVDQWYKNDELVIKCYEKIEQVYNSSLSKEEKIEQRDQLLEDLRRQQCFLFQTLIPGTNTPGLVSDVTYSRYGPLAKKVYEKAGSVKEAVKVFKNLSYMLKYQKHMYDEDYIRSYCKKYLEDYLNS